MKPHLPNNCPVRERTADGVNVGRCCFHLPDGKTCSRHGNVEAAITLYRESGKLTDENDLSRDRKASAT